MQNQLVRSSSDSVVGGVCGGLANYFGLDATIVRLVFVVAVLSGLSPLIYIILWIVMPQAGSVQPKSFLDNQARPGTDPTGEWRYDPYTGEQIKK